MQLGVPDAPWARDLLPLCYVLWLPAPGLLVCADGRERHAAELSA
jgi:hypothetical protein